MRTTGTNSSHQTLTPEAASVLKHSLTMAKRRGHSQITPLHVAFTLLTSSRQNLFARACLKSPPFHGINRQISHPSLHCRALELCFNVALNRLPTNPNPLFQSQPSLSNALIAALKRAQAHQRRGCVEHQNHQQQQQQQQQQQPFLAVKIELEQLVVSILDDPSVSRVMREAGFSSTVVKNNIEDDFSVVSPVYHGSSVGVFSSPCSPSSSGKDQNPRKFWQAQIINPTFDPNPGFRFNQNRNFNTVSVPSGGIGITLHASRTPESRMSISQNPSQILDIKPFSEKYEVEDELNCCRECVCNYKKDAQDLNAAQQMRLHPSLQLQGDNAKQKDELIGLRRKWNRFCQTLHQDNKPRNTHSLFGKSSSYPTSPSNWLPVQTNTPTTSPDSISFADSNLNLNCRTPSPVAKFRRQNSCTIEFNFSNESHMGKLAGDPNLNSFRENEDEDTKISLSLGRSSPLTSEEEIRERRAKMIDLSNNLLENLPWQRKNLHLIEEMVAESCRKSDVWMLIGGNDLTGKRRLARVIAESLFGSAGYLLEIKMRKRRREEERCSQILSRTLRENQNLVVLVEGVDSVNTRFMKFLSDAFQTGEFGELNRKNVKNGQVFFVLTREDDCLSEEEEDEITDQDFVIKMALKVEKAGSERKRKCEFGTLNGLKNPRMGEKEEESTVSCDASNIKKEFSGQTRLADSIDLNLTASEDNQGEIGLEFFSLIQNRFDFNRDQTAEPELKEGYSIKIKKSFDEILGEQETIRFVVEEETAKRLCSASGFFLNNTFEKWLKEVFQTCLVTVKKGGNDGIGVIKLGFEGVHEKIYKEEDGFLGTCLPKEIQVFNVLD